MARETGREAGGTQSVERALSLLLAFTEESPQRRVSELVAASGLGQSTVSRLVGALTNLGYLAHDERSGLYSLGPQVVRLGSTALNASIVHQHSRQPAQNLAFSMGLGANVAERHGDRLFYLCNFEGPQAPRSATLVGRHAPLHATALGKALLSDAGAKELRDIVGTEYTQYTPHTITTLSALETDLGAVRARGYATEVEEVAFGRACVAAPVRDRAGTIVAALSVSGPLSVMNLAEREAELARAAIECADQISSELGYYGGAVL